MKEEELLSRTRKENRVELELTPLNDVCITLPEDVIEILSKLSGEAILKIEVKALSVNSPHELDLRVFKEWAVKRVGLCYKYTKQQGDPKNYEREEVPPSLHTMITTGFQDGPTPPEERKRINRNYPGKLKRAKGQDSQDLESQRDQLMELIVLKDEIRGFLKNQENEPIPTKAQFDEREQNRGFRKLVETIEKQREELERDANLRSHNDTKSTDSQDLLPGDHILD